ncbi:hypothetical protein KIW84_071120 [Lathyrus oleraceus]|uniref:Uncharacterized protein n=1 Tax=Pisum sativum TaxID=3888 RepID=A0A9D4ZT79_PEA|nr:hypothetical protein KIW84_071120 [Pisum sativum]
MCKCRSHGTFPLFGLQSSHLNICYYHQDLHRRPLRPGSRPGFCSDRAPPTHQGLALAPTAGTRPRAPAILRETSEGNQLLDGSISLSPLYPSQTNDLHVSIAAGLHQSFLGFAPLRHSSPSFGSRQVCSHSNPSQKIRVGRRCNPQEDPTNQLPCALRVYSPVDSHTCQTPWSVFQDGSNGEPTGRRQERASAEARRISARCRPQS